MRQFEQYLSFLDTFATQSDRYQAQAVFTAYVVDDVPPDIFRRAMDVTRNTIEKNSTPQVER